MGWSTNQDTPKRRLRYGLLMRLAKHAPKTGDFVEVGVYRGRVARLLYALTERKGRKLYLYDTFNGHPYPFVRKKFPTDGMGAHVPKAGDVERLYHDVPNAIITEGIFPQSAVPMGKLAFAHVDVDSYQSTLETINHLKPLMVDGGIMLFDDYGKHAGCKKAVHEMFGQSFKHIHYVPVLRRAFVVKNVDPHKAARVWHIP